MKKANIVGVFVLAWVLIPLGAFAASGPSFFEPYTVLFNTVYSDSHYQASGLWTYKVQSGYGTAAVFQTGAADNYNTGAAEQGSITFGPYNLPNDPAIFLSFWYLWETESSPFYDIMTLEVSTGGPDGPYDVLVDNSALKAHHPANEWAAMKWIGLGDYADEQIYLRFSFDTIDAIDNAYKGWKIDFLTIYGSHFSSVFAPMRILDLTFDERDNADTLARDYSGNGHHGTISEANHRSYSGIDEYGGYLDARGTLDVVVSDHTDFDNLAAFALDMWAHPTGTSGYIISRSNQLALRYNTAETITLYVYNGTSWKSATSTGIVPLNQWSHVALIYDGKDQVIFYVNGAYAGCGLQLEEMAMGAGDLHIGTLWGSTNNQFTGYLSDVRLASIEDWMSLNVNIINDGPDPNVYRWGLYRRHGEWHREAGTAAINEDLLGGVIDLSDPEILNLAAEIGVPTNTITHNGQAWSRIVSIWNWLKDARLPDTDECNDFHRGYLAEDIAYQVARCGGYYTMNGGTCGAQAKMLTGLMRLAGIHPGMVGRGQCRYRTATGYASHAWGAVHLVGRWIPLDPTTMSAHDPAIGEIRSMTKLADHFDYANPFTWSMAPGGFVTDGIPAVEPAFNGGGQIEPIQILYPAPEAQVVGDAVMVAGRISTYPMIPLPDLVIINGVQVPVHDNNYFITTLPAHFTGGQMDIFATTDSGLESALITVYPD